MIKYTNNTGVSLPIAVWLATDNYTGRSGTNPYTISATGLLKSPRQITLERRAKDKEISVEIQSLLKSKIGTEIHSGIENAWKSPKLQSTLLSLGYPEELVQKIVVNPTVVLPGEIPVYVEQRHNKSFGKWTLTGEFDFVFDGALSDTKSTSTFTYTKGIKEEDFIKQGSFYRWLVPNKITKDYMTIEFVFTDWKKNMATEASYPPSPLHSQSFPLMSIQETEKWIGERLNLIETLELVDEPDLPHCTDEELWRSKSVHKYYASGVVGTRSTKNFDDPNEAYARKLKDGGKGLVLEVKGAPTACEYCSVSSLCSQKDIYIHSGELVL